MYKTRLRGCIDGATSQFGYVETDPSGRYGRFSEADRSIFMQKMEVSEFREILGKGAVKTVYMAFDEVLGIEVAWNQAKLNDAFRSPEELQRLYTEAYLLKNLKHDSIIKFYASWIDIDKRTFNFITEMFTSGTLREYRQKYQRVDIRAIKTWARQILHGLTYLHSHYPPVIHRDLKCDNIFVNGHLGQVKIGDLGLAAVLRRSQRAHSVIGTPEFMAPELYEEEYNELVDVYSFGMCMLEMLTSEYPYSECSNPAQIYKKVTSRKLPEAFYRIEDAQAQKFVGKCLETASKRLPAKELLLDRFLACDGSELLPISKIPLQRITPNGSLEEIMPPMLADSTKTTEMTITGTMNVEDDTIFLKLQIADKDGHIRNVYFLFDILNDTAIDVAMEMVKDLEISDLEPLDIAEMIEEEISSLLPNWKEWGLSQVHHHQHSFSYEDSDEEIHNLFYSNSSASSSQASLWAFKSPYGNPLHHGKSVATSVGDWLQGELFVNDDASSESSLKSYKYSTFNYPDYNTSPGGEEPLCFAKTCRSANFSTGDIPNAKQHKQQNAALDSWRHGNSNLHGKLTLIRSAVDKRSQLLHRSLVEMIHKRRLFKTVGAVE